MVTIRNIHQQRDQIFELARRHGASNVRVFGSVARGIATDQSDVDFLVRFAPDRSLFDHGRLIDELETLLGTKVDVVSEGGMRERFREFVLKEAVPI